MQAMDDITTYFPRAVSYKHKMFMKLAPGDQFISILRSKLKAVGK